MRYALLLTAAAVIAVGLTTAAHPADRKAKPEAAVVAPPPVVRVQDCSVFYDDYARRGFGWGSGPGNSVGFGTFEGALPRYPDNSFPNWYGACAEWGHYSSAGTARW